MTPNKCKKCGKIGDHYVFCQTYQREVIEQKEKYVQAIEELKGIEYETAPGIQRPAHECTIAPRIEAYVAKLEAERDEFEELYAKEEKNAEAWSSSAMFEQERVKELQKQVETWENRWKFGRKSVKA